MKGTLLLLLSSNFGAIFVSFEDVFALMILIMLLKIVKVSREIITRNQSKIYESDILRLFSRVF